MLCETVAETCNLWREKWREPVIRTKACHLMLGEMIGLGIVLLSHFEVILAESGMR